MTDFLHAIRHYAVFTGRARRRELILFSLISALIVFALFIAGATLLGPEHPMSALPAYVAVLALACPSVAVWVRRIRDLDYPLWTVALLFAPLANVWIAVMMTFKAGTTGPNQHGPDPKAVTAAAVPTALAAPTL